VATGVGVATGTLDAVLAHRRLTPGECAQVAFSVASALAALHATGRAHGDVRASRILVDRDGNVALEDATPPSDGSQASEVSMADDVADLGRLLEAAMGEGAPSLFRQLLVTCRSADPEGRPGADELARLVVRACPPVPLRLGPATPAAGRSPNRVGVAVGLGIAVVAAVTAGKAWGGRAAPAGSQLPSLAVPRVSASTPAVMSSSGAPISPTPPVSRPPTTPRSADWGSVLAALDIARGRVLGSGRIGGVPAVDVPGSPAFRRDESLVRDLNHQGAVVRGLRTTLDVVTVETVTQQRVVLRVRDRLSAYSLVSPDGVVLHRVPARGARWWSLELRPVHGQWRFWDAHPSVAP
jgi:eukaryotic-like serine/threonine-protein kinase